MPTVQIFADQAALSSAAARLFAQLAQGATARNGRFLVALSGGSTPLSLFRLLRQPPYQHQIPWENTHVFWGDERLVPPDDPGSNYGQAFDTLLSHVAVPTQQIHRARGELVTSAAITEYAHQLQKIARNDNREDGRSWPCFDLAIMGLGADGHTASLFPGSVSPEETTQPVMAVTATYADRPAHRLTLTPLVFNDARHVLFLVTGANKADAVTAVLHGPKDLEKWPAQRIHPDPGQLVWFLDQDAAAQLPPS